jgi:hypothetical protein
LPLPLLLTFRSSHVSTPFVHYRKWIKKDRCLSEASFGPSHFLYCTNGNPLQGAATPGSPFFEFFLWRRKERISAAGPRPGLYPRRAIALITTQVHDERHWSASPVASSLRWSDDNLNTVYRMNPILTLTSPAAVLANGLEMKLKHSSTGQTVNQQRATNGLCCLNQPSPPQA